MFPTYTSALGTFRDAVGSVPYLIGRSDGRSHMTIFSGPTGPKILLAQNQVIMPYTVRFRIVGDGFPVPPSATAGAADLALPLGDGIA